MERTRRRRSLRLPGLPQVGQGAWPGAHLRCMVRTWGCLISMACVLRGTWLGNDISQHAGFHFTCQDLLRISKALSGSARSVSYWSPFARVQLLTLSRFHLLPTCAF